MILLPKYKGFSQEKTVGEYKILIPDPPDLRLIGNKDLPTHKQKFIPTLVPKDIMQWDKKSRDEFEDNEWGKRNNGYWFWNNNNLEWITGTNYFYVNFWKIDIGLPSFIDSDRDWFYMWWYVQNNPKAKGFINLENRRGGKTWRGVCCVFEATSKTPNAQSGIQSKTDTDGGKVFKKLVFSWRKVPYFFKPIDSGDSNPKTRLDFIEPSKRNSKVQHKEYSLALDSFIDYESSGEEAYDGTKQLVNYQDEIGKTKTINVNERIKIVSECVVDGSKIIGKIIATSTVEELEKKGGKFCKMVWDRSDPNKDLLPNGQTQSGLLRYFKPSEYGYRGEDENGKPFIDEYGYSDVKRTGEYLDKILAALKTREDKNSFRRKYPRKITDCFIQDSKKSVYDTDKIEQQKNHNETLPDNILVRGDFKWTDGEKDKLPVIWHPNENGKWLVAWMPKPEDRCKQVFKNSLRTPANTDVGCFGLDPYDNRVTVDSRKSDAASYGFRKFDPMVPYDSGIFVSEYVNRPELPEIMWEDVILQSVFYGWEVLIETNKIGTTNYFRMRGYWNYLMKRPEETQTDSSKSMDDPGIPMSGAEPRQALVYATESHIINRVGLIQEEGIAPYMGKCYFKKLLDNWDEFDFDAEWTKFDSMVGAGLALLGARKYIPRKKNRETIKLFESMDSASSNSWNASNGLPPQRIKKEDK